MTKMYTPWTEYMEPFKIKGNLYYVGCYAASSHLIDTGDGLILIDTGYPQNLYLLINSIYKLGFSPYDVKYILHSHGHYDHLGGTKAFCELTGAKTFLGHGDETYADGTEDLTWATELGYKYYEAFTPDVIMHDGDVIELGNTKIEVVSTPGHTPGTMSFFFDIEEDGKTYHVAMHGGVGSNSLTKDFLDKYNLPYSLRDEFIQGIDKVIDREVDIFIGNHVWNNKTDERYKKLVNGDKDAFFDKEQWKNFLNGVKKEFENLEKQGL